MIYLSLGSNLGNRLNNLQKAVEWIKERRLLKDLVCSVVLETKALLLKNAPRDWDIPFLNLVVGGACSLPPEVLLEKLKAIEIELGRDLSAPPWSPRPIDIDILLYHQEVYNSPNLTIPHAEILARPFLLHLMAMMNPCLVLPGSDQTFGALALADLEVSQSFLRSFALFPKLVGIVNVTPNSFSDGGLALVPEKALELIQLLVDQGASVVEIGAQSTRKGIRLIRASEELARLEPILDLLLPFWQEKKLEISLDSFSPEVIKPLLKKYPIAWINDQMGQLDAATLSLLAQEGKRLCIMHHMGIPTQDSLLPQAQKTIIPVRQWAEQTLVALEPYHFKLEQIILDPGIGFGKSMYQNLSLLREIEALKALGCPVLVGHSRKSYMGSFLHTKPSARDLETIAVSHYLKNAQVDYLRIHNIEDHQRYFTALAAIGAGGSALNPAREKPLVPIYPKS